MPRNDRKERDDKVVGWGPSFVGMTDGRDDIVKKTQKVNKNGFHKKRAAFQEITTKKKALSVLIFVNLCRQIKFSHDT